MDKARAPESARAQLIDLSARLREASELYQLVLIQRYHGFTILDSITHTNGFDAHAARFAGKLSHKTMFQF